MKEKYIIDTSIWRDYFEDRRDNIRPLGEFAFQLLKKIKQDNEIILISDILIEELEKYLGGNKSMDILNTFKEICNKIEISKKQFMEAKSVSLKRKLPIGDVLTAILARDNNAILVTRDRHFLDLDDISRPYKPEELI